MVQNACLMLIVLYLIIRDIKYKLDKLKQIAFTGYVNVLFYS